MKKILLVLGFVILGWMLVSCSPTVSDTRVFVSVNKQIYTEADIIRDDHNQFMSVRIVEGDFEYYQLKSDNSAELKAFATLGSISTTPNGNGIFTVNLPGNQSYQIYVAPEGTMTSSQIAVSNLRVNFSSDATKEQKQEIVAGMHYVRVVNTPDFSLLQIIANDYNAESSADLQVYGYDDFTINWNNYENVKFSSGVDIVIGFSVENTTITKGITTHIYRPGDNELPIHVNLENNIIGYIWDFVFIIPISFVLQFFAGIFFNSFAVGIIFATIIVRTIAWPIYAKTSDMSIKMSLMKPEMNRIQKKYEGRTDPASKQRMQMETMALYKKNGVSIFGCLTPILQMPLFLAMFQTVQRVTVSGGMFTSNVSNRTIFFGAVDLTTGGFGDIWNMIFAVIVGATMFALQEIAKKKPKYMKETSSHQMKSEQEKKSEATMKTVNVVMIVMMVVMTASMPKALGLYWVVGNLYSLGQTLINRRLSERKYHKEKAKQSII